ncbi:hypothetical protein MBELCI_2287 [Limimaricola cinnabarinus LL-001]|uniref:Glycosyltransferase n=2 Tax=Limimaricola cinnabarinus TaxID=1125964 RepID=U2Z4C1_9RHOB|nr:hypothetical protein MBELCI_2287 [Limimaricola cinnabarinus LL-001]
MARLCADPVQAGRMGGVARETVAARFGADVMRAKLCDLYDATLAGTQLSSTTPEPAI